MQQRRETAPKRCMSERTTFAMGARGVRRTSVALVMLALGCGPSQPSHLEAGFPALELWPPPRTPHATTSTTQIDLDDVAVLAPIQLVDGRPMKMKSISLGKPNVLLPKSKGTYYPAEHPLSDRRAMVRRIREDKYGRQLEQYEGYLVDFEDGVIETFDSISPYEQYSEAGIGFAWKTIDGVKTRVLVHADGQVVPLWPEADAAPDLLLHPIWKQAWIFGVEEVPTPDPLDDPEKTELRSVYVHWSDLRDAPPLEGPRVTLPFLVRFDERVINNEDESVHGPRPKQQADVPFVLRGSLGGCSAVELDRNGSFHCRYGSYRTLADGWSYTLFEDENWDTYVEFRNRETGEVQVVRGRNEGDDCGVRHAVMEPPRVLLGCDEVSAFLLWTPERTFEYPERVHGNGSTLSDDGLLLQSFEYYQDSRGYAEYARRWVDFEVPALAEFPGRQASREHKGYPYHGKWLFTADIETSRMFTTPLGGSEQRGLSLKRTCREPFGFADWEGDSLLLSCWGPPPNPKWLVGLELGRASVYPLVGADNRESLLTRTHVLSTRNGQKELVVWSRGRTWPTSSPD